MSRDMLKFSGSVIWRLGTRATVKKYTSGAAVPKPENLELTRPMAVKTPKSATEPNDGPGLVAAAFASLNSPEEEQKKSSPKSVKLSRTQMIDTQILKAADVNSLLVVAEGAIVSRRHALKMVSILSEWSSNGKVKLADFEKDPRFLKLCRILARTPSAQAISSLTMAEDLSTVLGITGDDEAARLITNLTLPQMIKVMKALQQKGRRSTPLLRALSHSISSQAEVIDLKKSADLLFSMASLNFPDPVLMDRICNDVIECLPSNSEKAAVVSSITTSLGLLKYRHEGALEALAGWLVAHRDKCRAADLVSALVTHAALNYVPASAPQLLELAQLVTADELPKPQSWLDAVFALATLRRASPRQLASALQPDFIERLLSAGEISIPSRRKLMMLEAYLSLTSPGGDAGVRLAEGVAVGVPVLYTKEKQLYVQSIMDTFKSMVSADTFLKKECNSGMGFLYDAEFAVDSKCHPVPLEKAAKDTSVHRIAVVALDYHDMTRKVVAPLGLHSLCTTLLELKGYKVLQIPYTEFNPKDKLVSRVQYIQKRLQDIVADKS